MPTLARADFLAEFPELDQAPTPVLDAKLAEAHRSFCETALGDRYLDAVKYKAAHLVACSPHGLELRLSKSSAESIYSEPLEAVLATIPAAPFVLS